MNRWMTPSASASSGSESGKRSSFTNSTAADAHHDHELRLHDVDLARQPGGRVGGILGPELEAVRAVDRERIDLQPLERLQNRLARAPEERHALLDLLVLRRVLQEEDVGERVARSHDRDAQLVAGPGKLVAELVDLGDGLPQVALVDLVGGHGR